MSSTTTWLSHLTRISGLTSLGRLCFYWAISVELGGQTVHLLSASAAQRRSVQVVANSVLICDEVTVFYVHSSGWTSVVTVYQTCSSLLDQFWIKCKEWQDTEEIGDVNEWILQFKLCKRVQQVKWESVMTPKIDLAGSKEFIMFQSSPIHPNPTCQQNGV